MAGKRNLTAACTLVLARHFVVALKIEAASLPAVGPTGPSFSILNQACSPEPTHSAETAAKRRLVAARPVPSRSAPDHFSRNPCCRCELFHPHQSRKSEEHWLAHTRSRQDTRSPAHPIP